MGRGRGGERMPWLLSIGMTIFILGCVGRFLRSRGPASVRFGDSWTRLDVEDGRMVTMTVVDGFIIWVKIHARSSFWKGTKWTTVWAARRSRRSEAREGSR